MIHSRPLLIDALFAGGTIRLEPEGQESGIGKRAVHGRVAVDRTGLAGDLHCDARVHGGPEKAVHQFAVGSYARLAAHAPECRQALTVGSIGENMSARGMDETNVHIGDVFRAGTVLLEVSQPRSPCWKIDRRYGVDGLVAFIAREGITGWYYRVIEPGYVEAGDVIALVDRCNEAPSIERFWQIQSAHRPDLDALRRLADAPKLSEAWKHRLAQRLGWLQSRG